MMTSIKFAKIGALFVFMALSVSHSGLTGGAPPPTSAQGEPSDIAGPGQLACSDVGPGENFKSVSLTDIDPFAAVDVCYLTFKEEYWPTRFGIRSGFLYQADGVIYRVKDLTG